jgi:hypothetical protein
MQAHCWQQQQQQRQWCARGARYDSRGSASALYEFHSQQQQQQWRRQRDKLNSTPAAALSAPLSVIIPHSFYLLLIGGALISRFCGHRSSSFSCSREWERARSTLNSATASFHACLGELKNSQWCVKQTFNVFDLC